MLPSLILSSPFLIPPVSFPKNIQMLLVGKDLPASRSSVFIVESGMATAVSGICFLRSLVVMVLMRLGPVLPNL